MTKSVNDNNITDGKVYEDEYTYRPRERAGAKKSPKKADGNNKERAVKKPADAHGEEKPKKKINKLAVGIPVGVIAAGLIGVCAFSMSLPKNKVADNVSFGDIDLGGMTEAQARDALEDVISGDSVFSVSSGGKTTQISAADIDLSVNAAESAKEAIRLGKSNNIFKNAYSAVKLLMDKEYVRIVVDCDEEKLDKALFDFGTEINGVSTEAKYEFGTDTMTIIPPSAGQDPDTSHARGEFLEAVSKGNFSDISVTLNYAEPKKLDTDAVYDEVCKEAQDASYERGEDGKITVKEHSYGVKLDKNELKSAIDRVNSGEKATMKADIVAPKKTKEALEQSLFSATIGSYSTDFSSSSANRADNVSHAAGSINGVVLMPGETFSYNGTIGNPSLANGYKVAPVFENGKKAEGVGGGVCQVSSTLYSAVLYADLSIVERHNHSLTVGYVPKGQDATVSYGSLDFKFKNSTDYPIKINSTVSERKLTIAIIGTKYSPDRKIELSHQLVSTISPTEHITNDPSLPQGTRKVTSSGKNGYVVDSYKTIYENGQKTNSKKISRSTYKMTPAEVVVGTGAAAQTSAPQPAENTAPVPENNKEPESASSEKPSEASESFERPAPSSGEASAEENAVSPAGEEAAEE